MSFKFKVNNIDIELFTDDPNQVIQPMYRGEPSGIATIQSTIAHGYGAFGHTLDPDQITAIDLHAVLQYEGFSVEVLEGLEKLSPYNPDIPEGSVT